jgi:hypothetical protein
MLLLKHEKLLIHMLMIGLIDRPLTRLFEHSTITPAAFGDIQQQQQQEKRKVWVQSDTSHPETLSELGIILQKSQSDQTTVDKLLHHNGVRKKESHHGGYKSTHKKCPESTQRSKKVVTNSTVLYRGSNWSAKDKMKRQQNRNPKNQRKKYSPVAIRAPGDVPSYFTPTIKSTDSLLNSGSVSGLHVHGNNDKKRVMLNVPSHDNIDTRQSVKSNSSCSLDAMTDNSVNF